MRYEYGKWAEGEWSKEVKLGENNSETEWQKTYQNRQGSTVSIESSGGALTTFTYDALDGESQIGKSAIAGPLVTS